jgi:hypothetical protein
MMCLEGVVEDRGGYKILAFRSAHRATGIERDDYLFSVRATRDEFARIDFENLENVDPVEAFGAFEMRRN